MSQVIMGTDQSPDELLQRLSEVDVTAIKNVMSRLRLDTVYFLKGNAKGEEE